LPVIEKENGTTEVSAINPVTSMMAVDNPALKNYAGEVAKTLQKIMQSL